MADPKADVVSLVTLDELEDKANGGDPVAIEAFLQHFDGDRRGLIRAARGDLGDSVAIVLTDALLDHYPLMKHAVTAKYDQIRSDLAGPNPSPLETLLADRVGLCWLEIHLHDLLYIDPERKSKDSIKVLEFRDRMRDRADRRYMRAIKTLATVRKMRLPNVTVFLSDPAKAIEGG